MALARRRLDVVLVQRGLAETRERAHSLILSGAVSVDGAQATRPAQLVGADTVVTIAETTQQYVSRGGLKLEAALDAWQIDPSGKVALDVGASTGGFTDLLIQRGAKKVYAIDVGRGQLHYKLRGDPRIISMERTNIRHLRELPEAPDLAVVDVSFISLKLALPPVFALLKPEADIVALIKPQFEAGRQHVKKGGVVRDPAIHEMVLETLTEWSNAQPWCMTDVIASPIRGPAGNREFLSRWTRGGDTASLDRIRHALAEAAIMPRTPIIDDGPH